MEIVLQDGIKDCGICSLLSIIRYYGGNVSKEYLRKITNTTKNGVTAYNLVEAAKMIGFNAIGQCGDLEKIENNNLPCIAHVIINRKYQHFIVIYKIDLDKNKIIVMDPAKGKLILSKSEFKLMSSNNYIFLHPIKKLPIIKEKKIVHTNIKNTIKKYKLWLPYIIILTLIYFLLNIITAFHFKYLIEYSIKYNITDNILLISKIILIIYIIKELTIILRNILLVKWSNILDENITLKTFNQIILLPYYYYKNRTTGEIISRIKDLSSIKYFLTRLISCLTTDLLSLIIFFVFLFHINKLISIIVFSLMISIFLINIILRKLKYQTKLKAYNDEDRLNNYLIENLASAQVIKNMHSEHQTQKNFKRRYIRLLSSTYKVNIIEIIEEYLKKNIINFIYVIVFVMGSIEVVNKKMSLGQLIIYETLINYFINSFISIIDIEKDYHNYKLSLERIEELFTISKENFKGFNYYLPYKMNGDITYDNLTYKINSKKLFDNLSLKIKKGEKVLLCGPSGSGKSTLMKMLLRYVDVAYNNIKINDIDINHYHLENIRNSITYVSQQEFLYTTSIYNNIVMDKKIEDSLFKKVSKLTMVDKIIERDSMKREQLVEENGFNFSGGERQKIILTRALLKDSDIYIFDEALNQIDIDSELIILKNIFKCLKDKTIIVISHRYNNKELFNRIISIEKGRIVEE